MRKSLLAVFASLVGLSPALVPAVSPGMDDASSSARTIRLPYTTIRVFGEGDCSRMVIKMEVDVPSNVPGVHADYFVDANCRVIPDPPGVISSAPLAFDQAVPSDAISGRETQTDGMPPDGTSGVAGTCLGGNSDYVHTSQTQKDAFNVSVGKLNTVTLRWWDGSRTWMKNCDTFYSASASYTYKSWNHPKGNPTLLFYDKQCTQVVKCGTASSDWRANFHTDFAWCNYGFGGSGSGSTNQEFSLENLGTSLGNGGARGAYTQVFPCQGTHHATRTWHDSSASVDS